MKKMGSIAEFGPARDAELYNAFRNTVASTPTVDMDIIYHLTVRTPASRFWVSERRAAEVIAMMIRGISISSMTPSKREMYREIFNRFLSFRQSHPGSSIYEAVFSVVNSPAPQFYLTPKTAKIIICRHRAMLRSRKDKERKGGVR